MKTISVVIPCRNERAYISECVHAIYACDLPEMTEINIYVVDGMSDDGTRDIVEELQAKFNSLYLVDNYLQLTPYAFNLGIHKGGKTDYIQIVGARHILSQNYLKRCIEILETDKSVWCVGGAIINEYVNETGRVISKAMSTAFGMGLGNFRTLNKSGFTDTVTSPMYPYWVFEKIGFFDENLIRNQDDDFNFRVSKAGGEIYYANDISLKYYVRGDYFGLWRQFFQYGYWKVYVNQKHKAVTTLRQLVPPLFVMYLALFILSIIGGKFFFSIASLPLVIYLFLSFYFASKMHDEKTRTLDLMKTFLILHVSYGLGYLNGILDFFILNKKPSDKQKRLSR